jgi:hypothetical protein
MDAGIDVIDIFPEYAAATVMEVLYPLYSYNNRGIICSSNHGISSPFAGNIYTRVLLEPENSIVQVSGYSRHQYTVISAMDYILTYIIY